MQNHSSANGWGAFFGHRSIKDYALEKLSAVPDEFFIQDTYYGMSFRNDLRRIANMFTRRVNYSANLLGHLAGPHAMEEDSEPEAAVFKVLNDELNFPISFSEILLDVYQETPEDDLKQMGNSLKEMGINLIERIPVGFQLGQVAYRMRADMSPGTLKGIYRSIMHFQLEPSEKIRLLQTRLDFERECG